ncbi:MAG TPA: hypothetical protein DCE56_43800 [Cyanobacteria bacterium UBA8553]|nr:hypothetical protein [Cyanobacteria bacterium UBA8553]
MGVFYLPSDPPGNQFPQLIAKVLLHRTKKTEKTRISVHFNGLELLAVDLSPRRFLLVTKNAEALIIDKLLNKNPSKERSICT